MSRYEFQNKIYNLSLDLGDRLNLALFKKIWWQNSGRVKKHRGFFDEVRATSRKLRTIALSYQMLTTAKHPDFLRKCQIQLIFKVQWQISNLILEFKCTHIIGVIFDGIRFGRIFFTIKNFSPRCEECTCDYLCHVT